MLNYQRVSTYSPAKNLIFFCRESMGIWLIGHGDSGNSTPSSWDMGPPIAIEISTYFTTAIPSNY